MPRFLFSQRQVSIRKYADGGRGRKSAEGSTDWDTLQWSGLVAAGLEYALSSQFMLYAGPRLQYHQLRGSQPGNSANLLEAGYWQLGLELGLKL